MSGENHEAIEMDACSAKNREETKVTINEDDSRVATSSEQPEPEGIHRNNDVAPPTPEGISYSDL